MLAGSRAGTIGTAARRRTHDASHLNLDALHPLDRRAEPGLAAERDRGSTGSLTWAWRRSAGTVLYVGASRSRQGLADRGGLSRGNEAFIKLQVDAHEVGLF